MQLKSKLPNVGVSIFTKMTALANRHDALNLAQGFPNFPSSEKLIELVHHYMKKGMNQYAPMPGLLQLRERISEKYAELYGMVYHPETEITITSGATQAIYTALAATLYEGDEVILFEPAYDCYAPAIRLHGAIPVSLHLSVPDFSIDWQLVKKAINNKTKMIIINTPQNPTGTVLSKKDFLKLENIVSSTDILILSDEVYEHIIFDDAKHESIMRYPKLAERSFVVFSFGKTYHNTGWKLGYVLAPASLTKEFRSIHQFLVFSSHTPTQYALADFMADKNEYLYVQEMYEKKRNLFLELIKDSRFKYTPSKGTYFQLLDYTNISDKNDIEYSEELTLQNKLATIPLSPFYKTAPELKFIRLCFAKTDETLNKAAEILCRI